VSCGKASCKAGNLLTAGDLLQFGNGLTQSWSLPSATCTSFAPKMVPLRAELGQTPMGDKQAWRGVGKPT
jgi:hypothetical protein